MEVKVQSSFWRILLAAVLLLALPACKPKDPKAISLADMAEIYGAMIRQLYATDGNQRPVLYVLKTTNDMLSRDDQNRLFQPINEDVQKGVTERLQDLPTRIVWVASDDQTFWENGMVKDNGAQISLGNLYPQQDDIVQAAGGLAFGNAGGFGKTYVLERKDGRWTVTGTTGSEWIS